MKQTILMSVLKHPQQQRKTTRETAASMDHSYCYGGTDGMQGAHEGLWRLNPWKQIEIVLYGMQLLVAYNDIKKDQEDKDACDAAKTSHFKPTWCSVSVATIVYPGCTESLIHHLLTKKISPVVIIKFIAAIKQYKFYDQTFYEQ